MIAARHTRRPRRAARAARFERATRTAERPRGDEERRRRVLALIVMAAVLATAIWVRLVYWQVVEHRALTADASAQYSSLVDIPAARGRILDRYGRPLAVNTTVYDVFIAPDQVPAPDRDRVATELNAVLGVPADAVSTLLLSNRQFAYIAKRQTPEKAQALAALKLPGVGLQPEQQRSYLPGGIPGTTLASNLLGFVNYAGVGQYGVESYYQAQLAGRNGYVSTYRDLAGRQVVLGNEAHRDAINGSDVQLGIDSDIQYAAEQAIAQGVRGSHAESGSALVMDPHTGQIVAWADYPAYNANDFANTDVARFFDPAVSYLYEPGSVMKVVTLSGALDANAITPQTTVFDPGGVRVDDYWIKDWDMAYHGIVTMTEILGLSLNVGAIKAQQLEGAANYYRYLRAFGFGKPSGVDVAGENSAALRLAPLSEWKSTQLATAAFGQGIGVDMVQMLAAVNVVANGGRYVQPHVAMTIGGAPVPAERAAQPQVISPKAAQQMTWMMEQVVQHGSGYKARIPGFGLDQTGKTGTSQIPVNGHYTNDVWASYVGFLPALNPRFTMLVVVRRPHNGSADHNEGYYISAPIWKQIAQTMILDWRITPDPR